MFRRNINSIVAAVFLFLLIAIPALAHGGEDEGAAETASNTAFALSGSTILIISVAVGILISIAVFAVSSTLNLRQIQVGVIGLATITAVIHILVGLNEFILLLNGLGYLALVGAIYLIPSLGGHRRTLTWILLGYSVVTIVLYFVSHPWGYEHGSLDRLGLATKLVEFALIGLISVDLWQSRETADLSATTAT